MGEHCAVCSTCWSGDDPSSLGCTGLACGRANRHEARHERPGSARTAFTRFLDDGRICLSNNAAEGALRNHLFAGSDGGGEHWAVIASLIETCKMNGVNPQAYLRDVLARIVARHPMGRIDELLPFAYVSAADKAAA